MSLEPPMSQFGKCHIYSLIYTIGLYDWCVLHMLVVFKNYCPMLKGLNKHFWGLQKSVDFGGTSFHLMPATCLY